MGEGVKLHESWRAPLADEFAAPYMQGLRSFLVAEKAAGKHIFPKGGEWFRALDLTPLDAFYGGGRDERTLELLAR